MTLIIALVLGMLGTMFLMLFLGTGRSGRLWRQLHLKTSEARRRIVWPGQQKRRIAQFGRELEAALPILTRCARSGYLPLDMLRETASKANGQHVKRVFRSVISAFEVGMGLESSLWRAYEFYPHPLFARLISALEFSRQTGGDPAFSLGAIYEISRSRETLRGEVREETAEARLSAILVAGLPLLTVAYALITRPDMLTPLLTYSVGRLALGYAVTSWVMGLVYLYLTLRRAEEGWEW